MDSTALTVDVPAPTGDTYWVPGLAFEGEVNEKSAKEFITALKAIPDAEAPLADGGTETPAAILIELNTTGGSVPDGHDIAKAIEEVPLQVICVVDGPMGAESMGFYILQSCDVRLMTKRAVLMLHQPHFSRAVSRGSETDWQNFASWLHVLNRAMMEHECRRMTLTTQQCVDAAVGGREWYMNWDEALHLKAVDGVVPSTASVIKALRNDRTVGEAILQWPPAPAKPAKK